jgi:pimeloyl-ACP methyl ester carboxylesterase
MKYITTILALIMLLGCTTEQLPYDKRFPDRTFVEVDGVNVNYIERGAGEYLVLIHGFASSVRTWQDVIPELARNYHVVALDLKGFGHTEKPLQSDYSTYGLSEFTRRTMDLLGIEQATLIGNSLGGAISLHLAANHPERVQRMVLIDAAAYPHKQPLLFNCAYLPGAGCLTSILITRPTFRNSLREVYFNDSLVTEQLVDDHYSIYDLENATDTMLEVLLARGAETESGKLPDYTKIDVPSLVLWGREDIWIPLEQGQRLAEELPQGQLSVIPDCGHVPQEEKPMVVAQMILDWLADNPVSASQRREIGVGGYPSMVTGSAYPAGVTPSAQPAATP